MAFNETLAGHVRDAVAGSRGVSEKRMFGGLCLLIHGNLFLGIPSVFQIEPGRRHLARWYEAVSESPSASA
jgi:hypothetical protein